MSSLRSEIEKLNKVIFDKEEIRRKNKENPFKIIYGNIPIILSAPHSVKQTRNGKIKEAEGETGAIVQILAKRTNAYAIYKTYNNNDDANYDISNNLYKEELKQIIESNNIKLLLDLHGAKYESNFSIDIGTDYGKNVKNSNIIHILKGCLKKHKIDNVKENEKFRASTLHTISKYISESTGISCVQLEVAGQYRYIENIDGVEKFINAIDDFIRNVVI